MRSLMDARTTQVVSLLTTLPSSAPAFTNFTRTPQSQPTSVKRRKSGPHLTDADDVGDGYEVCGVVERERLHLLTGSRAGPVWARKLTPDRLKTTNKCLIAGHTSTRVY